MSFLVGVMLMVGSSPLTRGKHAALDRRRERRGIIPAHAGKTRPGTSCSVTRGDHPRSRGENQASTRTARNPSGSSPLTRGKPRLFGVADRAPGLIPAHAGKTFRAGFRLALVAAHPRSRGENAGKTLDVLVAPGSSPLTRGKRLDEACSVLISGLIPAHAGKTTGRSAPRARPRAHPRSRGENPASARRCPAARGSSPLTRGKPVCWLCGKPIDRLIPAHAGKTSSRRVIGCWSWAHPRSRGENYRLRRENGLVSGSSPLTRGKQLTDGGNVAVFGLIPAHAGKTLRATTIGSHAGAHPRSRGENRRCRRTTWACSGSSPLTRGKRPDAHRVGRHPRLIPAHAGKTRASGRFDIGLRAHPRSRGENARPHPSELLFLGSSPLTRGKQKHGPLRRHPSGLIPAHAGKTRFWRTMVFGRGAHPRSRGENVEARTSSGMRTWLIPAHAGKTESNGRAVTHSWAHPRSRGENLIGVAADLAAQGSSPLTRGKPTARTASWARTRAHPRSRGENGL